MKTKGSKNTAAKRRHEDDYSDLDLAALVRVRPRDLPVGKLPEFIKRLDHVYIIPQHRPKRQITIRLDTDVLDWLRQSGKGYQTKLNALLREAMVASRSRAK